MATLRTNRGDGSLAIIFGPAQEFGSESGAVASVEIIGTHWDGDGRYPIQMKIEGLWVRRGDFVELRKHLQDWLRLPLQALEPEVLNREFTFTRLPGQDLTFRFGAREDTIDERKPTVTVHAAAGALSGEWHFVTDQSCLGQFEEELAEWINGTTS